MRRQWTSRAMAGAKCQQHLIDRLFIGNLERFVKGNPQYHLHGFIRYRALPVRTGLPAITGSGDTGMVDWECSIEYGDQGERLKTTVEEWFLTHKPKEHDYGDEKTVDCESNREEQRHVQAQG